MLTKRIPLSMMAILAAMVAAPQAVLAQGALERLGNLLQRAEDAVEDARAPAERPAEVPRAQSPAYLGAQLDNVDPDVPGLIVMHVNPGGPAQRAGMRVGDVIVAANDQEVTNLEAFGEFFRTLSPGDELELAFDRAGQMRQLTLQLTAPPAADAPPAAEPPPTDEPLLQPPGIPQIPRPDRPEGQDPDPLGLEGMAPPPAERPARGRLGVRVIPLTEPVREQGRIAATRGALVQSVTPGSVADRGGIPVGAVIVSFDERRVDNPADLVDMVQAVPLDRPVAVHYYLNNRLHSTELFFGEPERGLPPQIPPQGPPPVGPERDRPGMRLLERALDGIQGGEPPRGYDPQEVIQLRNRVQQLETELDRLRQELAAMRNGDQPMEPETDADP